MKLVLDGTYCCHMTLSFLLFLLFPSNAIRHLLEKPKLSFLHYDWLATLFLLHHHHPIRCLRHLLLPLAISIHFCTFVDHSFAW